MIMVVEEILNKPHVKMLTLQQSNAFLKLSCHDIFRQKKFCI
jgi:hypothetical protein